MTDPRPDAATIFSDALELPSSEREAFVARQCGSDEALRTEVEALLAVLPEAERVLDPRAVAAEVDESVRGLESRMIGTRVDAYCIIGLLGTGGMGAVYLGERSDAEFDKRVAIKLFRTSVGSDAMLERFRTERRVLAALEHANIARLLDGGATDDGVPYIIMEHVDGVAIDRHADDARLELNERLRIFQFVCEAVRYAHQNLVIHRDLKPSNILVSRDGQPKLLDFGIAKVVDDSVDPAQHTVTNLRMLTPRYASPEQIRGEPVTTATDVYSLGVVLHELLTGLHPHDRGTQSSTGLERIIAEEDAVRPSVALDRDPERAERAARARGTDVRGLRSRLRGDLDTVVLKAIDNDPARRYDSVGAFSEDIRRHLEGHTVLARPDTIRYRTMKFARRNKPIVLGILGVVLALVAGLVATRSQYVRADRERMRAEDQTREATWIAYAAKVSAAENAIRANEIEDAERFLDDAPVELRGWEWHHLRRRLDRSLASIPAHDFWVTALAFSPDGQLLVSGSYDQTVKVWELDPPRLRHTLRRPLTLTGLASWEFGVLDIDVLPDARRAVVNYLHESDPGDAKAGGAVVIWDLERGEALESFRDPGLSWWHGDVDRTGRLIAVGNRSGTVRVFEGGLRDVVATFDASPSTDGTFQRLHSVAFHPDQPIVATARSRIETWRATDGSPLAAFPSTPDRPSTLRYSNRGDRLAAIMRRGPVTIWDTSTVTALTHFAGHQGAVQDLVFGDTDEEIFSVGDDARVLAWDSRTGTIRRTLRGHRSAVRAIAMSDDGRRLATGDERGELRIWSPETSDVPKRTIQQAWRPMWPTEAIPTPDGRGILSAGTHKQVERWDRDGTDRGELLRELDTCGARALALSDDGDLLVVANDRGCVTVADYSARRLERVFWAHGGHVVDVDIHPDGVHFATVGDDSLLRVWRRDDLDTPVHTSKHHSPTTAVGFDRSGSSVLVGTRGGAITIVNSTTGALVTKIDAHAGSVADLVVAPDGETFVTASADGSVREWRLPGGESLRVLVDGDAPMDAVVFHPDGSRIFAGGDGGAIRVIGATLGREIVRLGGHQAAIRSLSVGDDGLLVSTSRDGTVRWWDPHPARQAEIEEQLPVPVAPVHAEAGLDGDDVVSRDLVAAWRGDDSARDAVGAHHGVLQNGARFAGGVIGEAFEFQDPLAVVRIEPVPRCLQSGDDYSIVLWASLADSTSSGTVISCRPERWHFARKGWTLRRSAETWRLGRAEPQEPALLVPGSADGGRFTHLALVVEPRFERVTLYVDGTPHVGPGDLFADVALPGTALLRIGRDAYHEDTTWDPLSGRVDEVEVYDRALRASEIRAFASRYAR